MSNKNVMFGTPIWTYNFNDISNEQLEREGIGYQAGTNYFDLPGQEIAKLKKKMRTICEEIAIEYRWNNMPNGIHGIQNPIFPNGFDTPHFHTGPKMIAVYYAIAKENCGDIIFHDPRGGTDWPDLNARTESTGRTQRIYHRVSPVPGLLVAFPSYLIHSVEPNYSDSLRLSIAMSIYE